jgi:hypothetical protein
VSKERRWQALCTELKLAGELIRTTEGSAAQDHGRFCQPWYPCRHVVIYDALTYTQRAVDDALTTLVDLRCMSCASCAARSL